MNPMQVKIGAVVVVGAEHHYAWKEQIADLATGAYVDMSGGKYGTTTENYAVEMNNAAVSSGTTARLHQRGLVGGQMVFEFDHRAAGTVSGSGTDNHVARWDGTTDIQDSNATLADDGELALYDGAALPASPYAGLVPLDVSALFPTRLGGTAALARFAPDGAGSRFTMLGQASAADGGAFFATDSSPTYYWQLKVVPAASGTPARAAFTSYSGPSTPIDCYLYASNVFCRALSLGSEDDFLASAGIVVTGGSADIVQVALPNAPAAPKFQIAGNATALPTYSIVHNSVNYDGATGALAPGATVKGGLVVTVGSGTFGDALTSGTLAQFAATTSLQLKGVISDETGSGALVFATSPTLVTPLLGTPTSGALANCTGYPASALAGSTLAVGVTGSSLTSLGVQAAALNMGSHQLNNLTDPTANQDATTKSYVDAAVAALAAKDDAIYATTAALAAYTYNNGAAGVGATITLTVAAVLVVGGGTPTVGQRVLVKDETGGNAPCNGIYSLTTAGVLGTVQAVLTRTTDFDLPGDGINGALVAVIAGTNAGTLWYCTAAGSITFGTTNITFSAFTGTTYTADETTLHLSGTTFSVKSTWIGQSSITTLGTVTIGVWNGTVIAKAYGGTGEDNSTGGTANTFWARPNGATGAAAYRAIVAADVPTLNQNTTGSAASLSIAGQTGLLTFVGLASTGRAKTVRDAADTLLELGGSYTPTGIWTNLTLVTPALGTPASGTLTNCAGYTAANVASLSALAQADVHFTPDADDSLFGYDVGAAANRRYTFDRVLGMGLAFQARLTLESGVPVSATDQTGKSTLYLTPANGNRVALYDGTRWTAFAISEFAIALSGLTSAKPYDVWCFTTTATPSSTNTSTDVVTFGSAQGWQTGAMVLAASTVGGLTAGTVYFWNAVSTTTGSFYDTLAHAITGGATGKIDLTANVTQALTAVSLEVLVWTSDTARATALATQDGVNVKSGDTTRRYVGSFYTTATTTTEDSLANRYVWSAYNQVPRRIHVCPGYSDNAANTSYTTTSAAWVGANGASGNQISYVVGTGGAPSFVGCTGLFQNGSAEAGVGIGCDSSSNARVRAQENAAGAIGTHSCSTGDANAVGRHYYTLLIRSGGGTTTFYADLNRATSETVDDKTTFLEGWVWG